MVRRSGLVFFWIVAATLHGGARAAGGPSPSPAPSKARVAAPVPVPPMGVPPLAAMPPAPFMETPGLVPSPSSGKEDCTAVVIDKALACLSYVQSGSNLTRPEKGCCTGFAGLVKSSPECLCVLLSSNGAAATYGVDRTRALMLPTVCRVQTPPLSLCSMFGVPVGSPMVSGMAPSSGSPTSSIGSTPSTGSGSPPASSPPLPGNGVGPSFRSSSVLALLAGLSFAGIAIF